MARAKFQVLVIPYRKVGERLLCCVFTRSDLPIVQFIAGGGEGSETPLEAARREAFEEAGVGSESELLRLDTISSIPSDCFRNALELWGDDCYVIPEYCFAVELYDEPKLSREHTAYEWLEFGEAEKRLEYDSNRTALWELGERIRRNRQKKSTANSSN